MNVRSNREIIVCLITLFSCLWNVIFVSWSQLFDYTTNNARNDAMEVNCVEFSHFAHQYRAFIGRK